MFCDRVAASMIYYPNNYTTSKPLEYFMLNQHNYCMNEESKQTLRNMLEMYAQKGLDETVAYIKKEILK